MYKNMLAVGKSVWRVGNEPTYVWKVYFRNVESRKVAQMMSEVCAFCDRNDLMFWRGDLSVRLSSRNVEGRCLDSDITEFLKKLATEKQVTFVLDSICTDATPGAIMGLRF